MTAPRLRPRFARATLGASGARAPLGFTLLEVMVALALVAGAFMALAQLAGGALRNHAYARDLSDATLLARGKLAELEEKYDDVGFKDFDEDEEGDFSAEGRADIRWKVQLKRPDASLSAEQLVGVLAGAEGGDAQELLQMLLGGGEKKDERSSGPTTASPVAAAAGGMLQTQLTTFGEQLKKSLREMTFTVTWKDGKADHSFAVTSHLVVLNPRAPGGARGDSPDVPPNLAAAAPVAAGAQAPGFGPRNPGSPLAPGFRRPPKQKVDE